MGESLILVSVRICTFGHYNLDDDYNSFARTYTIRTLDAR